jgi:hypothetical protein
METSAHELERVGSRVDLSIGELDAEKAQELPGRTLMRSHRSFFFRRNSFFVRHDRFHHVNQFNRFDHFNRFNRFDHFGGNRFFGSAVATNRTFQTNFNPQISFGGGFISSHNVNLNTTNQVVSPVNIGF